jgi:microcystin-dependent protein
VVLNQSKCIFRGKNEFRKIPFLSANWWNRPRAFYGMGLGLIVGQNQRVDQGTINAILKILSYGVNPIYLRNRDDNAPTQTIRTGLGKIMSVTDVDKSYKLLDTPKMPADIWAALKESEQATESSSGADQMLVQGSSAGPRSSMGRTAGGANILAGASATRLDGPLDNFIEQVFKPFLAVIDNLVFNVMSDAAIYHILGKEQGGDFLSDFNLQDFHNAQIEYEVLAGSSLAAKRTMAQSMVMLTQILDNPQIQQSLADINEEYIDYKPIITMWLEASEWKNKNDIIKPMTADMKKKRDANSKAAQMQMQIQAKQQGDQQKFAQKQQLEDQASDNRIKRDITREAAKASGLSEAVEGEPSTQGLEGRMPTVV